MPLGRKYKILITLFARNYNLKFSDYDNVFNNNYVKNTYSYIKNTYWSFLAPLFLRKNNPCSF